MSSELTQVAFFTRRKGPVPESPSFGPGRQCHAFQGHKRPWNGWRLSEFLSSTTWDMVKAQSCFFHRKSGLNSATKLPGVVEPLDLLNSQEP